MDKKTIKIAKKTTEQLLNLLGVEAGVSVEQTEDDIMEITLDTEDSGIVIGHHGDTLDSLQLILSLCIAKNLGKFVRVSVEVGDYKKNRSDWLKGLAVQTKNSVLEEKREIYLSTLKPWERRIIHLILKDDSEVVSQSEGVGKNRVLVVRPKI